MLAWLTTSDYLQIKFSEQKWIIIISTKIRLHTWRGFFPNIDFGKKTSQTIFVERIQVLYQYFRNDAEFYLLFILETNVDLCLQRNAVTVLKGTSLSSQVWAIHTWSLSCNQFISSHNFNRDRRRSQRKRSILRSMICSYCKSATLHFIIALRMVSGS